MKRRQ